MSSRYVVLDKETVKQILNRDEITILDLLIEKVHANEGSRKFEVNEIK